MLCTCIVSILDKCVVLVKVQSEDDETDEIRLVVTDNGTKHSSVAFRIIKVTCLRKGFIKYSCKKEAILYRVKQCGKCIYKVVFCTVESGLVIDYPSCIFRYVGCWW